jgi:hypothetical protein
MIKIALIFLILINFSVLPNKFCSDVNVIRKDECVKPCQSFVFNKTYIKWNLYTSKPHRRAFVFWGQSVFNRTYVIDKDGPGELTALDGAFFWHFGICNIDSGNIRYNINISSYN